MNQMKQLTASEARDLMNLSKTTGVYDYIAEAAHRGNNCVEVTYITEPEFKKLIDDGYRIFADHGKVELTKYYEGITTDYDGIFIDWEV